jgi:hypothetical protein
MRIFNSLLKRILMFLNKILPVIGLVSLVVACSPAPDNGSEEQVNTTYEAPAEESASQEAGAVDQSGTTQSTETFKIDGTAGKSGGQLTVNPPHGEPGHRCDIDVGAPLNSASTKPAPDAVKSSPAVSPTSSPSISAPKVTAPAPTGGATSGKLNPAHGEPGHRCEIAVGAPL